MKAFLPSLAFVLFTFCHAASAAPHTIAPAGAVIVRPNTTVAGEYESLAAAVASLPEDKSARTIFIYPGTYNEQVYISRTGPLSIYGYTHDPYSYAANLVTIQANVTAAQAGSNDASGTLRIHADDVRVYNVNVKNTHGPGTQAIALSQYGSRVGLYACAFYGYQDTLYASVGTQVYLRNYIQGATDFIFGRSGLAFFGGNTMGVSGPGWVTASGRQSNDSGSYVFDNNKIILAPDAVNGTEGKVYFGRPWGAFAKVIFKNTVVTAPFNKALWSVWNTNDERTSDIFFGEYNSTGSVVTDASRPSFATLLSESEAAKYTIASAVGSDWASWVDASYL
ncbi:hypothetical protein H0H81_009403 [Sphagnurus paluster]|uniref:Pectinesterase n=1 Tax=Sphagnurus paluster TaxID=117069 RepID=A0A9P7FUI6_9AGAR|nr:hypothetical protein H0H81_009403 [Sphagnurus paluster]